MAIVCLFKFKTAKAELYSDTSGCLHRLLWLLDSDIKCRLGLCGLPWQVLKQQQESARGMWSGASCEIHVCGFCFGLGHLVSVALPF